MLSFFPRGVLDEILNFESVSEDFPSYSPNKKEGKRAGVPQRKDDSPTTNKRRLAHYIVKATRLLLRKEEPHTTK